MTPLCTRVRDDAAVLSVPPQLNGVSAWIGLSKLNKAGTFQWTDGSPLGDGYAIWSQSRETNLGE